MTLANPKRLIAIPDVHGCIYHLRNLVENVLRFGDGDVLVFHGDYIDFRKLEHSLTGVPISSAQVVRYLTELRAKYPEQIVLLKGNHEALAEGFFYSMNPSDLHAWTSNGGAETLKSYNKVEDAKREMIPFIASLKLYYETPEWLFAHANVPDKPIKEATEEELIWSRGYYGGVKPLVCGHTIQSEVLKWGNKTLIDLGCFITGRLAAYDVIGQRIFEFVEKPIRDISPLQLIGRL